MSSEILSIYHCISFTSQMAGSHTPKIRGVPSGKKTVAQSFYRVTQRISLARIDRFFKIWVHMKALILLFHRRYDS